MNNKIVLIILAILLAPLAVYLKKGAGKDLVINIPLCFYILFSRGDSRALAGNKIDRELSPMFLLSFFINR